MRSVLKGVILKKTKKGRKYYGCENNPECEFMSWQKPSTKKCPKCGNAIDEEMVMCPSCGERLQDSKSQKTEFVSIHLVRWLLLLSIIIPLIGFILSLSLKSKYPLISKMLIKFSTFGVALLAMLFLLGVICYIAMTLSGVSFL